MISHASDETLRSAYADFQGDPPSKIPWLVRLLENPESPIALPGNIALQEHDYLHILLDLGMSPTRTRISPPSA